MAQQTGDVSTINVMNERTLYMMYDTEVVTATKNYISNLVTSVGSIHGTFYSSNPINSNIPNSDPDTVNNLSTALVACGLGNVSSFKFNKTVKLDAATSDLNSYLNSANCKSIGGKIYSWCFPDNCKSSNGSIAFSNFLAAKEEWGPKFKAYLSDKKVINGIMNEFGIEEGRWESYLNLGLFKLLQLTDSATATEVKGIWKDIYPELNLDPSLVFLNTSLYSTTWAIDAVKSAVGRVTSYTPPCYPSPEPVPCIPSTMNTYGAAVLDWVKKTKYYTGNRPDNVKIHSPYSCFTSNTKIQLAKNRTVAISTIKQGMSVLGQNGGFSQTTSEKVEMVLPSDTLIYGINDDEPFFVASHAFYTQDRGWCSLAPAVTNQENPDIKCNALREGDIVLKIKSIDGTDIEYHSIKIQKFSCSSLPAKSKVYGLHTVNGPRSYHANGYLVAMNYPTITKGRIKNAIETRLSAKERHELKSKLQSIAPLLEKSMGKGIADHLFDSMSTEIEEKRKEEKGIPFNSKKPLHLHNSYGMDIRHLKHLHFDIADEETTKQDDDKDEDKEDEKGVEADAMPIKAFAKTDGKTLVHSVSLDQGDLYINNKQINPSNVNFVTNNEMNFKTDDDRMHGHLTFSKDYQVIHGQIWDGDRKDKPVADQAFTSSLPPTTYYTEISTNSYKTADDAHKATDAKMTKSVPVLYGYKVIDEHPVKFLQIGDSQIDLQNETISIDPSGLQIVTVSFNINNDKVTKEASNDSSYPVQCQWTFNYDFGTFIGYAQKAEYKDVSGVKIVNGVDTTQFFRFTGNSNAASALNGHKDYAREKVAQNKFTAVTTQPTTKSAPLSHATADSPTLSMVDLMSTPLTGKVNPDDKDPTNVVSQSNTILIRNMKYVLATTGGSQWLDDFWGETTPTLNDKQKKVIENDENGASFYTNFCNAFLGRNLNKATTDKGGFSNKLSDKEEEELEAFLKHGLINVDGYHPQSNGAFVEALLQVQPKLVNYMNDTSRDWCYDLYTTVSSNKFLNSQVAYWTDHPDTAVQNAQRYGTLINTLGQDVNDWVDPKTKQKVPNKGTYLCGKFYESWLLASLQDKMTNSTFNVGGSDDDDKHGMSEYFRAVIDEIVNDGKFNVLDNKIKDQLSKNKVKEAFTEAAVQAGSSIDLANDILSMMRGLKNIPGLKQKLEVYQNKLKTKYGAKYAKTMACASFLFAIGSIVSIALQWNTMNDAQKAASILQSLSLAGQAVGDMIVAFGNEESGVYKFLVGDRTKEALSESLEVRQEAMEMTDPGSWQGEMAETLAGAMQDEEGTSWVNKALGNVFEGGFVGVVTKALGIAANVAACVVSWIDVADVFKKGSGATVLTKALTVLQAVVQTAMVVVDLVSLVVESTFLACAGPILAAAGIIIAIVLIFTTQKHPTPPADQWKEKVFDPWWNQNKDKHSKDWFKLKDQ